MSWKMLSSNFTGLYPYSCRHEIRRFKASPRLLAARAALCSRCCVARFTVCAGCQLFASVHVILPWHCCAVNVNLLFVCHNLNEKRFQKRNNV